MERIRLFDDSALYKFSLNNNNNNGRGEGGGKGHYTPLALFRGWQNWEWNEEYSQTFILCILHILFVRPNAFLLLVNELILNILTKIYDNIFSVSYTEQFSIIAL